MKTAGKLFRNVEAEADDDQGDDATLSAWTEEIQRRSRELRDGTVKGLRMEAHRIVASDLPGDEP